jgi:hypothetical protein
MSSNKIHDTSVLTALLVGFSEEENSFLRSILSEIGIATETQGDSAKALDRARELLFHALIIAYPNKTLGIDVLLERVRGHLSASHQATIALLGVRALLGEMAAWVGRGANFFVDINEAENTLAHELSRRVKAPRRHALRTVSRLRVKLDVGQRLTLCQTENVSLTGMLIRMAPIFPVGASLSFELVLPGDTVPVRGQGVVIRHTSQQRERISGLAVAFTSFLGKDQSRMANLLDAIARQITR